MEAMALHDASLLSLKKGLRVRKYLQEGFYSSNSSFLYSEIYNSGEGYEFHMMFVTSKDLSYLTIACNDISVCDGISIK